MWIYAKINVWYPKKQVQQFVDTIVSPVLTRLLLDELKAYEVKNHKAQADSQQHQITRVQRVTVHAHDFYHLEEKGQREPTVFKLKPLTFRLKFEITF